MVVDRTSGFQSPRNEPISKQGNLRKTTGFKAGDRVRLILGLESGLGNRIGVGVRVGLWDCVWIGMLGSGQVCTHCTLPGSRPADMPVLISSPISSAQCAAVQEQGHVSGFMLMIMIGFALGLGLW